jgi:hypothetical protein
MVYVVKDQCSAYTVYIDGITGASITEMEPTLAITEMEPTLATMVMISFDASHTEMNSTTQDSRSELQIGRGTMHAIYSTVLALCSHGIT